MLKTDDGSRGSLQCYWSNHSNLMRQLRFVALKCTLHSLYTQTSRNAAICRCSNHSNCIHKSWVNPDHQNTERKYSDHLWDSNTGHSACKSSMLLLDQGDLIVGPSLGRKTIKKCVATQNESAQTLSFKGLHLLYYMYLLCINTWLPKSRLNYKWIYIYTLLISLI